MIHKTHTKTASDAMTQLAYPFKIRNFNIFFGKIVMASLLFQVRCVRPVKSNDFLGIVFK